MLPLPGARDTATSDKAAAGRRGRVWQAIVEAATALLAREGPDGVTTRAVAAAAGVQSPTIYRLFGDKDGLLDAVAEAGFAAYLRAAEAAGPDLDDPVDDLRAGWDLAVDFGLTHPALYMLAFSGAGKPNSPAFTTSMEMLMRRIQRLAVRGVLAVDEALAAQIIHATARGAVLTTLSLPEDRRDPALRTAVREAMLAAITYQRPSVQQPGAAGAARALRAALPEQSSLSAAEQELLREWLDRLITDG